jgi:hypothetical protein
VLEQALLCVADKLAEIGDAVGNVVWPADPNIVGSGSLQYTYGSEDGGLYPLSELFFSQWTIPPQSDGDRFIVRDLAIHTLSMIPVLDAYTDLGNQTCATNFAQIAAGGTAEQTAASLALFTNTFGADGAFPPANVFPAFPPSTVPFFDSAGNNNSATIAASALALEAQILTSSRPGTPIEVKAKGKHRGDGDGNKAGAWKVCGEIAKPPRKTNPRPRCEISTTRNFHRRPRAALIQEPRSSR